MLKKFTLLSLFAFSLTGTARAEEKNIVETAKAAGKFTTLLKACTEAGLVETLEGKGPFTVFAPTDEAFAKIPADTLAAVLKDKEKLKAILLAHVLPAKVEAKEVKTMKAKSAGGHMLDIVVHDGTVTVDGAKVIKTDIECTNGVIHVIDTVIIPKM